MCTRWRIVVRRILSAARSSGYRRARFLCRTLSRCAGAGSSGPSPPMDEVLGDPGQIGTTCAFPRREYRGRSGGQQNAKFALLETFQCSIALAACDAMNGRRFDSAGRESFREAIRAVRCAQQERTFFVRAVLQQTDFSILLDFINADQRARPVWLRTYGDAQGFSRER